MVDNLNGTWTFSYVDETSLGYWKRSDFIINHIITNYIQRAHHPWDVEQIMFSNLCQLNI